MSLDYLDTLLSARDAVLEPMSHFNPNTRNNYQFGKRKAERFHKTELVALCQRRLAGRIVSGSIAKIRGLFLILHFSSLK